MGISKAMMEHVIYANARVAAERGGTTICCTRYGNVMCSRGSVIPLFIDQIRAGNPITITDPNMTRFLMNLDEAVDLVMFALSMQTRAICSSRSPTPPPSATWLRPCSSCSATPARTSSAPATARSCSRPDDPRGAPAQ